MTNTPPRASRFLAWPLDAGLIWVAVLLFTLEAAVSTRALNRAAKAEAPAAVIATAAAATSVDQSTIVTAGLAALTDASAAAVATPEPAPNVAEAASFYRVVVPLPPLR